MIVLRKFNTQYKDANTEPRAGGGSGYRAAVIVDRSEYDYYDALFIHIHTNRIIIRKSINSDCGGGNWCVLHNGGNKTKSIDYRDCIGPKPV